jgi:hypothetical protein
MLFVLLIGILYTDEVVTHMFKVTFLLLDNVNWPTTMSQRFPSLTCSLLQQI